MNNEMPAWYTSTQGPQISATVKYFAALLVPTLKAAFPQVTIFNDQLDALIDAALILVFAFLALRAHVRAKQTLQGEVAGLRAKVGAMSGTR